MDVIIRRVIVFVFRSTFFFLLIISSITVCAQAVEPQKERSHTIYPLATDLTLSSYGYAFISYQIAYGQKVNQKDQVLFGIKYHLTDEIGNHPSSPTYGFEFQYRFNLKKDLNVDFKSNIYVSPYFEYNNFGSDGDYGVGAVLVNKFRITNGIILDLFYGFGFMPIPFPSFKTGIQLGKAF